MRPPPPTAAVLAGILGVAGVAHLTRSAAFDELVPRVLPGPVRAWTLVSGVAELGVAALVVAPRTRRLGATVAAGLFVVVFPGNVQMAVDWWGRGGAARWVALARLPLQVPLVVLALVVRRGARRR